MSIKGFLLGTTASVLAVPFALAADAVTMVEPEPVEYVRVCDVYDTGYFYIPGTETCLKIGGYLRMRVQANDEQFNGDIDDDGSEDYTAGTRVRARLEFDAREETELGTLRSKIRVEANNTFGSTDPYVMDEGFIQLGGLTVGYLDSLWTNNEGGIEDGLLLDEFEFSAGDFNANRISYTYKAGNFSATLGIEDDGTGDFVPDVVGKLAYKDKWGGAYLLGAYDEDSGDNSRSRRGDDPFGLRTIYTFTTTEFDDLDEASDGAVVLKGGLQLNDLLAEKSVLKIEGHYAFDPSRYAVVSDLGGFSTGGTNDFNQTSFTSVNGGNFNLPSEWQIGAGYRQDFGKLFVIADGVYGQTFDISALSRSSGAAPVLDYGNVGSIDYFGVGADVGYKVTKNFTAKVEVSYVDLDLPAGIDDFDQTRGFLELRRDF